MTERLNRHDVDTSPLPQRLSEAARQIARKSADDTHTTIDVAHVGASHLSRNTSETTLALSPHAQALLFTCGLDPAYVSDLVGEGGNHRVYAYAVPGEKQQVIKIMKAGSEGFMTSGSEEDERNIPLVEKYFAPYVIETHVCHGKNNESVIVQEAVEGRPLTSHSESAEIKAQLQDIMRLNREMMRQEGVSLDFVGMPGFKSWLKYRAMKFVHSKPEFEISNIMVTPQGHLKIVDGDILRFRDVPAKQRLVSNFGFTTNRMMLMWYFGVDMKPS